MDGVCGYTNQYLRLNSAAKIISIRIIFIGVTGLIFLLSAVVVGEEMEQALTVAGASFLALAHWLNYRLCRTRRRRLLWT